MWKKRFAAILLWTLCLTSMLVLAVSTNAQATTAEASGKSAASLTRGEWIHRLVTKFDLSVSKSDYPDNYYPDLSEDNTYYPDIMTAVVYGLIDVKAGENLEPDAAVTREFAAHTMNLQSGFKVDEGDTSITFNDADDCKYLEDDKVAVSRKWLSLSNGSFLPEGKLTEAEAQTMLQEGQKVTQSETVETDYENAYEIDLDGTAVELPENTKYEWIDKETLKVPVIVIGVPTIIDSSIIVADTINFMLKKFSYDKNNINNKQDKLKFKIDYKDYDKDLDKDEKKYLLGIVGTLSEDELQRLVFEVLNPIDYNYMVTPKEIDFLIDKLSLLIGHGLNMALHSVKRSYSDV